MQELYADSIAFRYGSRQILSSVHLSCRTGETLGLLGRNGSGKSTLLKILFGSLRPDHIHLKLNGVLMSRAYLSREIAYLPQDFFMPSRLKISQLVKLYTRRYRDELLTTALIRANLDEQIGNLSGGQRRLAECLLILYSDSPFILLDEPFSQLSPLAAAEMQAHVRHMAAVKGIVITDHYYKYVLDISSRIMLLHNGCNYAIGDPEKDLQLYGYLPAID